MLNYYQFRNMFIRHTKNACTSIVNEDILKTAKDTPNTEYYYKFLRKRISIADNIGMNMYLCCKVLATYLISSGIEPEITGLLQGRIPSSVFVNHYYRPNIYKIITKKIRPILDNLLKEIMGLLRLTLSIR